MERINRFFDSGSFSYDIILGCGTFYFLANGNMAPLNTLLIDADGIVYRCGFATEKVKYLVYAVDLEQAHFYDTAKEAQAHVGKDGFDTLWSRKELKPEEECLSLVKTVLDKIKAKFPDYENQRIILSNDGPTFRHRLATISNYKGTRSKDRPAHYASIRSYLFDTCAAELAGPGLESDDTISVLSSISGNREKVVVSLDKDLDQIPGLHYNWVKEETYEIDKRQACLNLYSQILSGDPTDNIRGIEGIGPVKAHQMLKDCTGVRDCWETVLRAYTSKYGELGKDYAIETARLCYLLRKEGEVWQPPAAE